MKGYHVSRSLSQHSSGGGHTHCDPSPGPGSVREYHRHPSEHYDRAGHPFYPPGGPPEPLALEHRSHTHSGGGTFPRSHPSQHPPPQQLYDSCEDCLSTVGGHGGKMHRMPPDLQDQFEKQLPFHPDGFHTLQYQRRASGAEQRSESPSRIRHLVHSVQKLFAKSHSLEAPSKREYNGTRGGESRERVGGGPRSGGEEGGGSHNSSGHQSRSARRSKSRERSKSGDGRHESSGRRHRSRTAGWWSSDDNLDSDSSFLVTGGNTGPGGRGGGRGGYPTGHDRGVVGYHGGPGQHSLKRSTWSAMTVSQAREVSVRGGGGGGGGGYDKALVPLENKLKERTFHYLQLGDSLNRQFEAVCETMFGEIESQAVEALDLPGCFRTRSHSYVRAIQAGCSQDDDCLSVFSISGPPGSIKGGAGEFVCVCVSIHTVDSSGTLSDSDAEALREVHSVGVQVEEEKRRAGFKRSNSVTAGVQADLDPEGGYPGLTITVPTQDKSLQFGCSFQRHSSEPVSADQYAEYHRTVHTQGQWAYREDYVQDGYATDPHQIPPLPPRAHSPLPLAADRGGWTGTPQPSLEGGPRSLPDSGRASPCLRDGEFFLRLLQMEVERMEGWCQNIEREAEENELPEEVLELIRNAVGSAQMLMSQKVQQFFRLCQQSVDPSAYPQPTSQDLSGLWDLLQLNMEDVRVKFQHLQRLKDSGWRLPPDKKKLPPPLPKNGGVGRAVPVREKSLDLGDRQRTEARRRLLQTKRSASFRQNSATESADSMEIYIPEAQTRL
uniref:Discs, large (Drosophila) homolog-associated protein 3 n=1 Tax=Hucho hucho TaxID=62062 RepID=A0A4W5QB77_9TELE